jgi:prolyl-tRNA editing enzyme YbaK/EbsC (Cys-tRNA(Pro) deacylase)
MKKAVAPSALRVQELLGPRYEVLEFDARTATAAAVGATVGQIAKSLVFRSRSGRPVLVVASGSNRVDESKVGAILGEPIGRADADFVRVNTGFAIGGVPPVGHAVTPTVLIDADLQAFDIIWAAAGTPNAVFRLRPADLPELTGGRFADVARR